MLAWFKAPENQSKDYTIQFGGRPENYSSGVIALDSSEISLSIVFHLIQPLYEQLRVNISLSMTKPSILVAIEDGHIDPISTTHSNQTLPRYGFNYLGYDQPVYLLPGSVLKYQLVTTNITKFIQLCLFDSKKSYMGFLTGHIQSSEQCTNVTKDNFVQFDIPKTAPYYAAIEVHGETTVTGKVSANRAHYDTVGMQLTDACPRLLSPDNRYCVAPLCNNTLCTSTKYKYVTLQSSESITMKYKTFTISKGTIIWPIVLFIITGLFLVVIIVRLCVYCTNCSKSTIDPGMCVYSCTLQ